MLAQCFAFIKSEENWIIGWWWWWLFLLLYYNHSQPFEYSFSILLRCHRIAAQRLWHAMRFLCTMAIGCVWLFSISVCCNRLCRADKYHSNFYIFVLRAYLWLVWTLDIGHRTSNTDHIITKLDGQNACVFHRQFHEIGHNTSNNNALRWCCCFANATFNKPKLLSA